MNLSSLYLLTEENSINADSKVSESIPVPVHAGLLITSSCPPKLEFSVNLFPLPNSFSDEFNLSAINDCKSSSASTAVALRGVFNNIFLPIIDPYHLFHQQPYRLNQVFPPFVL